MADGQVIFEIKGDASNVNQTVKQVTSNIQNESKKWDQAAGQSTSNIEKSFANMAGNIVGKLTAAGIGAVLLNWGKAAVEAASDLAEVQNVVDTVFGDGANQIESWAKKAGQQFGLTETQAKKFTSTLGAMMKSSGLAGNEIVNMSTDLAGLAADMASFYNLDFETAFEKIRSGISGETMPLKQLGINMSVANLEAFALAQGLEKTFSEMTQGEQTMLRYQYLMQATADAQGDFEKTSDGFANAQRRIESSIDSIKTSVGNVLLPWIEKAIGGVAEFLSQISAGMMPERTVIDEFNDAEVDTATKLADIQATYDSAKDLIKILKEIEEETVTLQDGTTVSLTSLFGDIAEIEKAGGDIEAYIRSLGLDVNYVVGQYNQWKEATRQLTGLVPSLANQIDNETYSIKGGTAALQENLEQWKKTEESKVYWAEYYAKAEAVARAKGEQAGLQITAKARQNAATRARQEVERQAATLGIDLKYYEGNYDWSKFGGQINTRTQEQNDYNDAVDEYYRLQNLADQAQKKADKSANDLADAEGLLADELKVVEEITGETLATHEQGAKAAAEETHYLGKTTEEWVAALKTAPKAAEAIKSVIDYYKGVKDATEQAVKSTVKGFGEVTTAYDELKKKQAESAKSNGETEMKYQSEVNSLRKKFGENWMKRLQELGEASKEWKDLSDSEKEAYNALVKIKNEQKEVNDALKQYSPETLQNNLQSQIKFMEDYVKNLNQLKEWGVSDELIASLADGSKESAAFLQGLVEGGKEGTQAVDGLFQQVTEKKKGFTDTLTEYKLAADDTFSSLVESAKEAMEGLDLGTETEDAMNSTVLGIAQGIKDGIPEVSAAVNELMAVLSPLSSYGFTWGFQGGSFVLELDGSNEKGLDYVPFDGYLSELHEGEGILTAEENRIWQRFKNGQASSGNVDYDALGGVMRDNVKAGGDVYLDGRTVGAVVSGIQGRSYRNLQRSGWQG